VSNPVIDIECRSDGVEVAVVEHKQIFVLLCQTLYDVGLTLGEVPYVALIQDRNLVTTFFVHSCDGHLTSIDVAPFSLTPSSASSSPVIEASTYHTMPVKLTDRSFGKMLLCAGNIMA
jgi:hypothetical protein